MNWKITFHFDYEMDQDIIKMIQNIPRGQRTNVMREVFRDHFKTTPYKSSCSLCLGTGSFHNMTCEQCHGIYS